MQLRFLFISLIFVTLACDLSIPMPGGPGGVQLRVAGSEEPPVATETSVMPDESAASTETGLTPEFDSSPRTEFNAAGLNTGAGQGFIVLDNPAMIPAGQADWLQGDDIVLGAAQNGEAQAFPINQMAYHHIANTIIGGDPYLVTY